MLPQKYEGVDITLMKNAVPRSKKISFAAVFWVVKQRFPRTKRNVLQSRNVSITWAQIPRVLRSQFWGK